VKEADCVANRLEALARFFRACEEAQRDSASEIRYHAFVEVAYLLSDRICDAPVWDWLQEQVRNAPTERRENMRVALFEFVPDPPIFWPDVFRLWDMWFDPEARWAVYSAYFPFPRRVHAHFRRYCAHRRREGKALPKFSQDEFDQCLQQIRLSPP
jgi:hypothetical protein